MRWLHGADGPGADYCRQCQRLRRSPTRCDDCPEPVLLEENEPAVELYLATLTQWRHAADGRPTGLDYTALESAGRMCGIDTAADDVFEAVRELEAETLRVMSDGRTHTH